MAKGRHEQVGLGEGQGMPALALRRWVEFSQSGQGQGAGSEERRTQQRAGQCRVKAEGHVLRDCEWLT